MPKTVSDILQEHGISMSRRGFADGKMYTQCPACSHLRKKKRAECLMVVEHPTGVTFKCMHCDHKGGGFFDDLPQRRPERKRRDNPRPKPLRSYYS